MTDRIRNLLITVATAFIITSFGIVAINECPNPPENIVVYEGTENIILSCGLEPSAEMWTIRPASLAVKEIQITNFTDSVSPTLAGLYAINQTGLIIRNATTNSTGNQTSAAGLYYVYFADGNKTALKVVVIRSGPTCSLTQSASEGISMTCTIIFADIPTIPMNPIINCTADGQVYTGPATKTLITPYVYNSTTVIKISNSSIAPSTYDCRATFSPPAINNNPNYNYVVTKAPIFTANVTVTKTEITTELPTTSTEIQTTTGKTLSTTTVLLTTGESFDGALLAKVILGSVLGTLMLVTAAIGGLLCFFCCCPLFIASSIAIPSRQLVEDIQRLPRREWIPVPRVRRRVEYRIIPFYKQSFSRFPTPYEYRLP